MEKDIYSYLKKFGDKSPQELLERALSACKKKIALASSLGAEDQVLTDMILKIDPGAGIFTLDTGRLPQETYDLIDETREKYKMRYEVYFPVARDVEKMERECGANLFYRSLQYRKMCCGARKVGPLKRALKPLKAWITGLRREQAESRAGVDRVEWDGVHGLVKLNPLADWTLDEVWKYIKDNNVPYNKLHGRGYPSIGCAPCTRAVKEGENIREGRWWWEIEGKKECGLHYGHAKQQGGLKK